MKPSPLEIDTNNSDNNEYQIANTVSPTNNEETPPSTPFHLLDEEGKNEVSRNSSSMSIKSSTNDDENENSCEYLPLKPFSNIFNLIIRLTQLYLCCFSLVPTYLPTTYQSQTN